MPINHNSMKQIDDINTAFHNVLGAISEFELIINNEIVSRSIHISELIDDCEEFCHE
tara:strand:- start:404 stop:574 length:171 start_codon:yes stop_codon:yes gene_type:complete